MRERRLFICTPKRTWVCSLLSGALIFVSTGCGREKKQVQTGSAATAASIQHGSKDILGGSFVVGPGNHKLFSVAVTAAMKSPSVAGTFKASSGKKGIEVLVLDANEYLNWQNGHKFNATYSSGRTTAGKLDIQLPEEPGTYYLVFSNRFKDVAKKAVVAYIKLQYNQRG